MGNGRGNAIPHRLKYMPNGSRDFYEKELPALEAFFAPIAGSLTEFGIRHHLMLDRYYHQSPSWRFNFRHPKSGVGSLDVMKWTEDSIKISLLWWIDDYDKFTRFLRWDETQEYQVGSGDLAQILETQLRRVLSWEPGEWTQVAADYEQLWKPYPREWIETDVERYPTPKLEHGDKPDVK